MERMHSIFSKNGVLGGTIVTFDHSRMNTYSYGNAYPDSIPFTDSTFLRIASISKMFTGMAVLQLVEEGKIELDRDINSYLDFKLSNPNYPKIPITIRMLLNHTSTLQDSKQVLIMAKKAIFRDTLNPQSPIPDIRELFKYGNHFLPKTIKHRNGRIARVIPGQYFHYTNLNFVIIAHIIESIEQQPFHVIIRNALLNRYSIPGGFIVQDIPKNAILSPQYQSNGSNWIPEADIYNAPYDSIFTSIKEYVPGRNVLRFSPQAGLRLSSIGLATFFRSFLSDSSMLLIRNTMFNTTWKSTNDNHSYQFDDLFREWGMACHIIRKPQEPFTKDLPWIGHIGRANGATTFLYCSPSTQRGIIMYINGMKNIPHGNIGFMPIEKEIINVIFNNQWK